MQDDDTTTVAAKHTVRLPGFIRPEREVGLGDLVKHATTSVGVTPCGGCAKRAAAMNRMVAFAPRSTDRAT